ncbi:MAG: ATP-binding cassette domain-containing protein [Kiritimatiellae bacterium]|nr:ATP-binding cassette domain-containing protein [Kiritimatiellia bacterium]
MIRFEHVTKTFGNGKRVLDDVSFEIAKGEIFTIVGPSGTGKSVTLKHMIRLLTPTSGRVTVGGECVSEATGKALSRIRSRFGYLFQSGALLAWMDVADNVALPLREKTNLTEGEIARRVDAALDAVGLAGEGASMPSDLSGGMQKRAGLARAIVTEPEIVLYDEPTSGLDPVTSRRIDELVSDLSSRLGITSVVVTHDLHSALSISDRIAMLGGGKVLAIEPPASFIRSTIPQARAFLDAQYVTRRGAWEKTTEE